MGKANSNQPQTRGEPVVFYVAWHPDCQEGGRLARALFDWFHLGDSDIGRMGIGVPVYYRSQPQFPSGREKKGPPREIDFTEATLNIVLLLIDKHMVTDRNWGGYIERMNRARKKANEKGPETYYGDRARIYPVALDETAFRIRGDIASENFLRIEERGDPEFDRKHRRSSRISRFLSQVTEFSCREMLKRRKIAIEGESARVTRIGRQDEEGDEFSPSKINVFLSHSKSDGADIAEALRDYMNRKSQMRPFYDAADLALGYRYARELNRKAEKGTVSMIAIHTDSYPFRPWCRREIRLARRPRIPETFQGQPERQCWWMNPVVIVAWLEKLETRTMPEFGQAPVIRWGEGRERDIIDILLRELFFQTYHYLWAIEKWDELEKKARQEKKSETLSKLHLLSWIPTLRTIEELRSQLIPSWEENPDAAGEENEDAAATKVEKAEPVRIYHPGQGLSREDAKIAKILLPPGSTLRSFDEIVDKKERHSSTERLLLVGVSISTDREEIGKLGYAPEHLAYYLLVIIRRMLRFGAHIAYGGELCELDHRQYTENMIQVAQEEFRVAPKSSVAEPKVKAPPEKSKYRSHMNERLEKAMRLPFEGLDHPSFYVFLAWPQAPSWPVDKRAQYVGSCEFVEIDGVDTKHGDHEQSAAAAAAAAGGRSALRLRRCLALSEMRYKMTFGDGEDGEAIWEPLAARVAMGGRLTDYQGILPGVFEEIYWALVRNKDEGIAEDERTALFIIGGLGGAAQSIANYLLDGDPDATPPPETKVDFFIKNGASGEPNRWETNQGILVIGYKNYAGKHKECKWTKHPEELSGEFRTLLQNARENEFELLANGLSVEENRRLMTSHNITTIYRMIETGMDRRYGRSKPADSRTGADPAGKGQPGS